MSVCKSGVTIMTAQENSKNETRKILAEAEKIRKIREAMERELAALPKL